MTYRPHNEAPEILSSFYIEAAGNGIIYSLNFDLVMENKGLRLGLTPYGLTQSYTYSDHHTSPFYEQITTDAFIAFLMGHYLIGNSASKLELGGGMLFGDVSHVRWKFPRPPGVTFTLGYRYLPREKKDVTFRFGFTPLLSKGKFHPRIGFSIGWMLSGSSR